MNLNSLTRNSVLTSFFFVVVLKKNLMFLDKISFTKGTAHVVLKAAIFDYLFQIRFTICSNKTKQ